MKNDIRIDLKNWRYCLEFPKILNQIYWLENKTLEDKGWPKI